MTDELQDKNTKNAKILAATKVTLRVLPQIILLIIEIGCLPFFKMMAPYISGEEELEEPFTNSQLTAMMCTLVIAGCILYLLKMVSKFSKR